MSLLHAAARAATVAGMLALAIPIAVAGDPVPESPSARLAASVDDPRLAALLVEVLDRNPELAALEARVAAAGLRAPQVSSLPDPQVELTAFLLTPETRVGPQRLSARLMQRFPWFGTLALREQAAGLEAAAAEAELEARRIRHLTEARRLWHELGYLDAAAEVIRLDRMTLERFEELALARYSSGRGLQSDVLAVQAEITRLEIRAVELDARRRSLAAELNALRDAAGGDTVGAAATRGPVAVPARAALLDLALVARPELAAADARIAKAELGAQLAEASGRPELTLGLGYTLVDPRRDADPPDNGQDVLAVTGGLSLPIWRQKVAAGVEEAIQLRIAAEADRRAVVTAIERELDDLLGQLPEIERRLRLFDRVLTTQAEQSLESAESAYASGKVDAVALLDAERTILDVRLAGIRADADRAVVVARLEAACATPFSPGGES